ncbi:MAG: pyruvate/oxaloacetate carboxyltransferase [Bacillota bacterium]
MGPLRLGITDTTFRDAHQSLLATRMTTGDMLPIAETMDNVGFHSMEVWGGATFDTCIRYLNEDPWERLRAIRAVLKNTKTQMLLRGQNLVGYRHYPDDILEEFVKRAVGNGIDIIRVFDALNDVRNMGKAMEVARAEGAHAQGTVVYTISPVHNVEHYVETARELRDLGAHSICIKDMAGILSPMVAHEMVLRLKADVGLPVQIHCHYTSGMASMTYWRAIEAGVDVVDCAISSLSMSTSQPPVESLVAALQGTAWDTGLDLAAMAEAARYFTAVRKKYGAYDVSMPVDVNVLVYQIPGGMISNFYSQLSQQNALDKINEVLAEVPRVRKDLGFPPLVTPSSQIVGSQAVLNVVMGERYKIVANEVRDYFRGKYGRSPAPVDDEVRRKVIGDEEPLEVRPADILEPGLERARKDAAAFIQAPEDVLTYALFPQVAEKFLKDKMARSTLVDSDLASQSRDQGSPGFYPAS